MDKIKSLIIIVAAFFSFSVFSSCSDDSSDKSDPTSELNAVRDVVTELNDIFYLVDTGNRDIQEKKQQDVVSRNFYPGMEDDTQEITLGGVALDSNPFDEGTGPAAMTAGTYTFTDDDGDFCELIIGTAVGDLYLVTLKIYPASSIEIDYIFEKINTNGTTWDPVDSEGVVDFTARDPYYVKYFDGRIEDITVVDVDNGVVTDDSLNLTIYSTIADYLTAAGFTSDADEYDYYSESTFTFAMDNDDDGAADTDTYGNGKRIYWEDKDAEGNILEAFTKEYNSRGYSVLWGLWSKSIIESYYSTYDASEEGVTVTYSISDIGTGALWSVDKDEQYLGKATKTVDGETITYDAQYQFYNEKLLGKDEYGVKIVDLDGTSTSMAGSIAIYKRRQKPNHSAFTNFPYDDYSTLTESSFVDLTASEITTLFGKHYTWTVTSTVATGSTYDTSISATDVELLDRDKDEYITHTVSVVYNKDNRRFDIEIKDAVGDTKVKITNASVKKDYIEGEAEVKSKQYDVKISHKGGGVFKKKDDTEYEEF